MTGTAKGNLLIAQGGGPTAVINCSLYGVIQQAAASDKIGRILGAKHGITGVLQGNVFDLRNQSAATIEGLKRTPAAALGSCRYNVKDEDYPRILDFLKTNDIRYFFYIGGNDSMDTAHKVHQLAQHEGYELYAIGIPKTVDNDLPLTDHCPGYGSAARYVAQSVRDLGADIRSLPTPVSVFEAMGRNAGWLTAAAALARTGADSAPHLIYLPERPFEMQQFLTDVDAVVSRLGWAVIVVSEGLKTAQGNPVYVNRSTAQTDAFGHRLPGDVGSFLAGEIAGQLRIRSRSEKPGICARASILCASPTDQAEAELTGQAAVDAALAGQSGLMVTLVRQSSDPYSCTTGLAPLDQVANTEHTIPNEYIATDRPFMTPAFYDYAQPLIGGALLDYTRLT